MLELLWVFAGGVLIGLLGVGAHLLRRLRSWSERADDAEALLARGEAALAQDRAASALEEAGDLLPETHPLLARLVALRGRIRLALGAVVAAEVDLKRALRLLERAHPDSVEPPQVLGMLATALRAQGRVLEAAQVADQALQAGTRLLSGDDPRLATLHATLGGCLLAAGSADRAEPHLRRAAEVLEEHAPDAPATRRLRQDLARLTDLQTARMPVPFLLDPVDQVIH
jgi:tetratricopeptide (TPR) repeat protein